MFLSLWDLKPWPLGWQSNAGLLCTRGWCLQKLTVQKLVKCRRCEAVGVLSCKLVEIAFHHWANSLGKSSRILTFATGRRNGRSNPRTLTEVELSQWEGAKLSGQLIGLTAKHTMAGRVATKTNGRSNALKSEKSVQTIETLELWPLQLTLLLWSVCLQLSLSLFFVLLVWVC